MATSFPTALDSYTTLVDNVDGIVAAHPNDRGDAIEALQAKVGIDSSAVTTSHDYQLRHLPSQGRDWSFGAYKVTARQLASNVAAGTAPLEVASSTVVTNLNADTVDGKHVAGTNGAGEITTNDGTQTLTNKTLTSPTINGGTVNATTLQLGSTNIMELVYPVGIVVTLGVSTNPGTLFGVGTWTAITGRVIVGKASSGTFGTADATGGAETVTLTAAQSGLPAHTHAQRIMAPSTGIGAVGVRGDNQASNTNVSHTASNTAANASEAHSNLQPYIVKYVWQRAS
jgi:hypothetical protein